MCPAPKAFSSDLPMEKANLGLKQLQLVCVHLKKNWVCSVSCKRVLGGSAEFLLMGIIKNSEQSQPASYGSKSFPVARG